ncbi:conserved protein, unknown function [Hepatocystis sp. ex Piliocolobus tephrosceles]|nr:conserved protein, unknown function [Hepatocystis sp. ex Piliocolobus tephrosceles]
MEGTEEKNEMTIIKSKDEEIFKLRKLVAIFKNECKKVKEENNKLKSSIGNNTNVTNENKEDSNNIMTGNISNNNEMFNNYKNEYNKRIVIEKSYKKLKEFTLLLEEKLRNIRNDNVNKIKNLEDKINENNKHISIYKSEIDNLKNIIKDNELIVTKLNSKIKEFRLYLNGENKNINLIENHIDEKISYKLEIKKLKESLNSIKKTEEINAKERQQYKNMIILCSQYKDKAKKIPLLENKIDILENKIQEYELATDRDKDKSNQIVELKKNVLNYQIENTKLENQLKEWIKFSQIYINDKVINTEELKQSMNEIHKKYNQINTKKTDIEIRYKQVALELEIEKQNVEDKDLELRIMKNKYEQISQKYDYLKKDFMYEVSKKGGGSGGGSLLSGEGSNMDVEKNKNEYKIEEYESIKEDNKKKEKLIDELNEKIKIYKNDYKTNLLKQKNNEIIANELEIYEKEITYLKEEINNYKNKIINLEKEIVHINNLWKEDVSKNNSIINDLKNSIKKNQSENKINNKNNRDITVIKENKEDVENSMNDISILYREINNLNTTEDIKLNTLQNENKYLKSKIEVIKFFYSNQIKSYREALLYILGWDIQIEQNNEDIFFIFTSLFSTHDGKFVFIKNKCTNEKRSYTDQNENYEKLKKMKYENGDDILTFSNNLLHMDIKQKSKDNNEHTGTINDLHEHVVEPIESNLCHEQINGAYNKSNFYDGLISEKNHINTNTLLEKTNFENTNINMSTIMKGCKYNLLLHGYYSIKWNQNIEWKNYVNKINTYPILLSLSCIEEYNSIKSQYNNTLSKNCKGMLFKI